MRRSIVSHSNIRLGCVRNPRDTEHRELLAPMLMRFLLNVGIGLLECCADLFHHGFDAACDGITDSFSDTEVTAADSIHADGARLYSERVSQIQDLCKRQHVGRACSAFRECQVRTLSIQDVSVGDS